MNILYYFDKLSDKAKAARRRKKEAILRQMIWKINYGDIDFTRKTRVNSMVSLSS